MEIFAWDTKKYSFDNMVEWDNIVEWKLEIKIGTTYPIAKSVDIVDWKWSFDINWLESNQKPWNYNYSIVLLRWKNKTTIKTGKFIINEKI